MDLKLEVVVVPVTDVDTAKHVYERLPKTTPTSADALVGGWAVRDSSS